MDALTCQPCWRSRAFPVMASACVPSWRWWTRRRSDARPAITSAGVPRDCAPTTTAVGCAAWDSVRGRSRCWPVQARDALPAIALACPIRTRWRSGCSNHGVESCAGVPLHGPLVPAQRLGSAAGVRMRLIDWERVLAASGYKNRPDSAGQL
jgi:hypothetical protein